MCARRSGLFCEGVYAEFRRKDEDSRSGSTRCVGSSTLDKA
ncbi:hypothetical protein A2U01_0069704 [Trifolium medium]|uniref:Uncharacterized protein n=1 Tax=Trifolium medium TaxID=97028 RepID=A0A392SHW5_9FABA|nr:hypothetical protein [Trifolium medium]